MPATMIRMKVLCWYVLYWVVLPPIIYKPMYNTPETPKYGSWIMQLPWDWGAQKCADTANITIDPKN